MYESDGSIMVYWHALDSPETPTGKPSYKLFFFLCRQSNAYLSEHNNLIILYCALKSVYATV